MQIPEQRLTLREHWANIGVTVSFDLVQDVVTIKKDGAPDTEMPSRFFPYKPEDFDREVAFRLVDLEDGHTPPQMVPYLV